MKNGARYLHDLLEAVRREGPDEILVIDSGSTDESVSIARAGGCKLLEVEPADFGHGRTRNLAAEASSGDLVCFLTQDATPVSGWLAAYREAFTLDDRVGAAFGPHLPRPGTSPMIARELTEFFAGFAPDGRPAVQEAGGEPFLSNVNACYSRECWEEIRFADVEYAEDQAFGRTMLERGWKKAYHPNAAVLHAHDYGVIEFMRRYFDEYRGLREATGHVEPWSAREAAGYVRAQLASDRAWMREQGMGQGEQARWLARAAAHHAGRKLASALGSRHNNLPPSVRELMSLEGRPGLREPAGVSAVPPARPMAAWPRQRELDAVKEFLERGPAPLLEPVPGMSDRESLHIAVIIPPFRIGSGGHNTIFQVTSRLERMGHTCSVWLHDPYGWQEHEWPAVIRRTMVDHFAPVQGPVFKEFGQWTGADVAMATGWQTVYPAMMLDNCRARAYFVNDHEPEFYPTSTEAHFAAASYRLGMHCVAASPWLRDLLVDRYEASATDFQLGVDHDVYQPRPVTRRRDTIVFYARKSTARRGVGMGLLAIEELLRRRPNLRVVLYGTKTPIEANFPYEHAGVVTPEQLSWLYSEATVGLCLSMTNFSLIPKEMLACGLPCVELEGISAESIFGPDGGPLELAPFRPDELADAMERLIVDERRWAERSRKGIEFVASHTWNEATRQTEAGLRQALELREREFALDAA